MLPSTTAGFVLTYSLLMITLWWLFHVAFHLWNTFLPPYFKYSAEWNRRKLIVIVVALVIGIVISFVPFIAAESDEGFSDPLVIPPVCLPDKTSVLFFSLILIVSILLALGVTFMTLLLRNIIKVNESGAYINYTVLISVCYLDITYVAIASTEVFLLPINVDLVLIRRLSETQLDAHIINNVTIIIHNAPFEM